MNVLVRNENHIEECLLIKDTDLRKGSILEHPEIKDFVGDRKVRTIAVWPPITQDDPTTVDLEMSPR